jgi:hypothetical protein
MNELKSDINNDLLYLSFLIKNINVSLITDIYEIIIKNIFCTVSITPIVDVSLYNNIYAGGEMVESYNGKLEFKINQQLNESKLCLVINKFNYNELHSILCSKYIYVYQYKKIYVIMSDLITHSFILEAILYPNNKNIEHLKLNIILDKLIHVNIFKTRRFGWFKTMDKKLYYNMSNAKWTVNSYMSHCCNAKWTVNSYMSNCCNMINDCEEILYNTKLKKIILNLITIYQNVVTILVILKYSI